MKRWGGVGGGAGGSNTFYESIHNDCIPISILNTLRRLISRYWSWNTSKGTCFGHRAAMLYTSLISGCQHAHVSMRICSL